MKVDKWLGVDMPTKLAVQCKTKFAETMTNSLTASQNAEKFFSPTTKNYLICGTTKEVIDNLRLSDKFFDYTKFDDSEATLLVDKDCYYRFFIAQAPDGSLCLNCMRFRKIGSLMGSRYSWDCFFVNLTQRTVVYSNKKLEERDMDKLPDFIKDFIKTMIFIYCSDNEIEIVEGGKSNGKPKNDGKVLNKSRLPITVVTSKWNTTTIRTTGFKVRGHFRFQPYGPKDAKRVKVIFIDPYEKKGYKRTGKK